MKNFINKKNGSTLVIVISVISIALLGAVGFYFLLKKDVVNESFESSISNIIKNSSGDVIDEGAVSVMHRDGIYLNGVVNVNSEGDKYFYLIYTSGVWHLVDYGKSVSCERLSALGFSREGSGGCVSTYSGSISAAEALAIGENSSTTVSVIGVVGFVDPNLGTFSISSGGKTIETINNTSNNITENVSVGDTVVVVGTIDNGVITPIEVVDLLEDKKTVPKDKNKVYKEPESSTGEIKYKFLYDLNQDELIRLRNDPSY